MASPRDAFSILMKGRKRDSSQDNSPRKSSFVLCPLGCGKNIAAATMSLHLDRCPTTKAESSTPSDHTTPVSKIDINVTSSDTKFDTNQDTSYEKPSRSIEKNSHNDRDITPVTNAYLHMMQHSQNFYRRSSDRVRNSRGVIRQRFHLHDVSGRLSWRSVNNDDDISSDSMLWESSVMIKQSKESDEDEIDMELIVSSSVQSLSLPSARSGEDPNRVLFVRQKSKLSVPVLKSILQKSIRRKRPLPSTKVAMELADKSLGDLLRRLPIINLEDSTLHPNFPFLVWLMVAESKNFNPPIELLVRVMRIVFEIAACNFKDHLSTPANNLCGTSTRMFSSKVRLTSSQEVFDDLGIDDNCMLFLRCMLLRKQYGGMAGDLQMLDDYLELWGARFIENLVPRDICERLQLDSPHLSSSSWQCVPEIIHRKPMDDSVIVTALVHEKLKSLSFYDTVIAGVDFHCSNIVETMLNDVTIRSDAATYIQRQHGHDGPISDEALGTIIRRAMWTCSSGINSKRPLMWDVKCDDEPKREQGDEELWTAVLKEPHRNYARSYISCRLAIM